MGELRNANNVFMQPCRPHCEVVCSDPEGRLLSIPRRAAFMSRALAMESGSSFRHIFRRRPKFPYGPASALYSTLSLKGRDAKGSWSSLANVLGSGLVSRRQAVWETFVRVIAPSKGRGPVLAPHGRQGQTRGLVSLSVYSV